MYAGTILPNAADGSRFDVSLTVTEGQIKSRDSVHRPQLFEERGLRKRNGTETLAAYCNHL